ncbi:hypothetical protein [Teredinibacter sp. KSP-S5-2]|uniref:hypothetical protein n=1 Tax=Teredinibacter sp. KSP-S5-2 TaxID=3034506 RepID=UPI002934D0F0|nr:hypothetical protein [Teredinibacter sp. KSP-S5-2]WNO09873.1 hypothetical protein P5V12_01635 [Teredinibacter sp. KSP-S5-2]
MKNSFSTFSFAAALVVAAIAFTDNISYATPKPDSPVLASDTTEPTLIEKKSKGLDTTKFAPNVSLSDYETIYVTDAEVSFSDRWLRDHKTDTSENYREKIKTKYAKLLHEEVTAVLKEETKYEVVVGLPREAATEKTLIIAPKLIDLHIYGPDDGGPRDKKYVNTAGIATFILDISDAKTGQPLAYLRDRRETQEKLGPNNMERATQVSNYHDFKMQIRRWSKNAAKIILQN